MPRALLEQGVDADGVARVRRRRSTRCAARGATLVDVELPHARYAIPVYYLVATAEASSNLARYDGVRYGFRASPGRRTPNQDLRRCTRRRAREGFGAEVKRRIMLGTYVLSAGYYDAYYLKAQQVRTLILRDYEQRVRPRVDVVAMPTSPTPAFRIGERVVGSAADVSRRHLHGQREPGRAAGDQRAVRLHAPMTTCRSACS